MGFSLRRLVLLQRVGCRACRLQELWYMVLAAPQYVGPSWTRDRTRVPCTGRWILNRWTTREVLAVPF